MLIYYVFTQIFNTQFLNMLTKQLIYFYDINNDKKMKIG